MPIPEETTDVPNTAQRFSEEEASRISELDDEIPDDTTTARPEITEEDINQIYTDLNEGTLTLRDLTIYQLEELRSQLFQDRLRMAGVEDPRAERTQAGMTRFSEMISDEFGRRQENPNAEEREYFNNIRRSWGREPVGENENFSGGLDETPTPDSTHTTTSSDVMDALADNMDNPTPENRTQAVRTTALYIERVLMEEHGWDGIPINAGRKLEELIDGMLDNEIFVEDIPSSMANIVRQFFRENPNLAPLDELGNMLSDSGDDFPSWADPANDPMNFRGDRLRQHQQGTVGTLSDEDIENRLNEISEILEDIEPGEVYSELLSERGILISEFRRRQRGEGPSPVTEEVRQFNTDTLEFESNPFENYTNADLERIRDEIDLATQHGEENPHPYTRDQISQELDNRASLGITDENFLDNFNDYFDRFAISTLRYDDIASIADNPEGLDDLAKEFSKVLAHRYRDQFNLTSEHFLSFTHSKQQSYYA